MDQSSASDEAIFAYIKEQYDFMQFVTHFAHSSGTERHVSITGYPVVGEEMELWFSYNLVTHEIQVHNMTKVVEEPSKNVTSLFRYKTFDFSWGSGIWEQRSKRWVTVVLHPENTVVDVSNKDIVLHQNGIEFITQGGIPK